MKFLSRIEEFLLVAVWKLRDEAYGITILEQVESDTSTKWPSGAVYGALSRLMNNGLLISHKGETRPERGGRHRIYYSLTREGKEKLAHIQAVSESLWNGVPKLKTER
ncbi:PadR family transcriptional regulator [candidate division KSB1 bacterium]